MNQIRTIVIDNGTGYTKMGPAGNLEPTHNIPSVIADRLEKGTVQISKMQNDNLDFYIGDEAFKHASTHQIIYPIATGQVKNWELMEKFWHRSIFDYLRVDPEDHIFVLTEPPMNAPENRESMAEIMFETFNVQGLYIGVQAVLALYSNQYVNATAKLNEGESEKNIKLDLTGTVLDSGDGVTHVIPVSDGYVIGSCIKHIPLAGRDMTKFIMQMLRDRNEPIPPEDIVQVAKKIKEKYSYVCKGDLVKEFESFDERQEADGTVKLSKKFKTYKGVNSVTKEKYSVDVGYERFLAGEMFFKPEFIDAKWKQSIDEVIDGAIQSCPIDTRRKLYENVVLSGGSSLIKGLDKRLKIELQKRVDGRLQKYKEKTGIESKKMPVNIIYNPHQKYSVWQGGSMMATNPNFSKMYHTREQYMEVGPSIARHNAVFAVGIQNILFPLITMSAADVGKQFVTAYYTTLQTNRESLITFYSESSSLTYGGQEFKGIKEISEKIESFGFQKIQYALDDFDVQLGPIANSLIVFVTGGLKMDDSDSFKFAQVFHLLPNNQGGFYCRNK